MNISPAAVGTASGLIREWTQIPPPQPHLKTVFHPLPPTATTEPLFFVMIDALPGEYYSAAIWVYVTDDFAGKNISLVFLGLSPAAIRQADLSVRNQWQRLTVEATVPEGTLQIAPSLIANHEAGSGILTAGWTVTRGQALAPAITPSATARFQILALEDIIKRGAETPDGRPLVTRTPCLPDVEVQIPQLTYGQRNPPDIFLEHPPNSWSLQSYVIKEASLFTLNNAVIHGEQGIITVGDFMVAESLYLAHPRFHGFVQPADANGYLDLPDYSPPKVWIDNAAHAMCGYVANRNYAHWWTNVVPAIMIPPFHDAFDGSTLMMPELRTAWQRDTLALIPEINGRSYFVGEHERIGCHTLRFIPKVNRSDFEPHPARHVILDKLKQRAGFHGRRARRIYLSRRDAAARKLLDEDKIESLLQLYGFEVMVMSGKSVPEQIRIFAEASHVISPHGAGLANIMFCRPDTALLEFQMASNVQWSIRRIAAVMRMRYGCIIGHAENDAANVWDRNWRVDLGALEAVLRDPAFIAEPV